MTITEVKFRRFINEGKLRAVVSLTFDGSFAVHDIKIVQGEERHSARGGATFCGYAQPP